MQLPILTPAAQSRDVMNTHLGLNMTLSPQDGEYAYMHNMTGDFFPVLSPRGQRRKCHTFVNPHGIYGKNKLLWVDGRDLYYNGAIVGQVSDTDKQFVGMAAYVLIFPDKLILNTHDLTLKPMNQVFSTVGTVTFSMSDAEGTAIVYVERDTEPEDPSNGDYWMDTSGANPSLKMYSEYTGMWSVVVSTYVRISATGIGTGFNQYDGVNVSGATDEQFNGDFILHAVGADFLVVTGLVTLTQTQTAPLTVKREAPDMDFLTECNNRVWGCSSAKHEVYASKLGDPFNWKAYEGLSTDAYAATIGSDGDFTGAATHMGYVLFFKENVIHKVMNVNPPFQISELAARGVQKGSENSLCAVDEMLFYKSIDGIMAYGGATPELASVALGGKSYKNAVGGAAKGKYYVSMEDADGEWDMFVYDLKTGLWHREDNVHAKWFTRCLSDTFFVDESNDLYSITREDVAMGFVNGMDEGLFDWAAESGDMLATTPDNKFVSKLQFRITMEQDSEISIAFQYDTSGEWETKYQLKNPTAKRSFTVPIIPQRCDHFRIRFYGRGDVKIYTVSKVLEQGSELL